LTSFLKTIGHQKVFWAKKGLLKQLTKAVLERAMQAELTRHLGYEKHSPAGHQSGNSRNGKSKKTLKGDFGTLPCH
jgi:putative transposase